MSTPYALAMHLPIVNDMDQVHSGSGEKHYLTLL